ncbi:MAG: 2-C-methyl-D-erythritol 4-phosphate cytidylyltransferase [Chloroflexi bacterium]|nr:2-C-methyl-D-erythritol 4-phosphate cytidylyltransferase [Chloroflexota bacterium]
MEENQLQTSVIIAAAGKSTRMGGADKQFLSLAGQPLLAHTVKVFDDSPLVSEIALVVNPDNVERVQELVSRCGWRKVSSVQPGGDRRQDSIWQGLMALSQPSWVAIHDGARPFITGEIIRRVLMEAQQYGAAIAAVPVKDTVKVVGPDLVIRQTPDRATLWAAQTPQVFRYELIMGAYRNAREKGLPATDDAQLVEQIGHPVKVSLGSYDNIKITTPEDVTLAELILSRGGNYQPATRVGIGYDVHPLVTGRKLILGGVQIPYPRGLDGYSDADVLLHSVMDALLGAAALGDLGKHFPPGDSAYKGISSLKLLNAVGEKLREQGWRVGNVDATIVAESPKLAPFIPRMVENTAEAVGAPADRISIKATTTEGLGFAGRGEGIAAYATALLQRVR